MSWFTDLLMRGAGLDPTRINPALPATRQLIADGKAIEPDVRMLIQLWTSKIDPALKRMLPVINSAIDEWDTIAPAADDVLALLGAGVKMPNVRKSLKLARPEIDLKWIQSALRSRGFDPGPIDGIFGTRTQAAVERYQRNRGLTVDHWPGPETVSKLISETGS